MAPVCCRRVVPRGTRRRYLPPSPGRSPPCQHRPPWLVEIVEWSILVTSTWLRAYLGGDSSYTRLEHPCWCYRWPAGDPRNLGEPHASDSVQAPKEADGGRPRACAPHNSIPPPGSMTPIPVVTTPCHARARPEDVGRDDVALFVEPVEDVGGQTVAAKEPV